MPIVTMKLKPQNETKQFKFHITQQTTIILGKKHHTHNKNKTQDKISSNTDKTSNPQLLPCFKKKN